MSLATPRRRCSLDLTASEAQLLLNVVQDELSFEEAVPLPDEQPVATQRLKRIARRLEDSLRYMAGT